ncbi:hypothetical protein LXM24_26345 [Dyadobacter sp. CY399]|uniref:Uncharacterized protein n=2 Tax=Dyadobacter fanqingshengii TaxID=2906443 RepID=A0A9X1TD03_9BACT|nr:hypothetical protein [Dyadobacter fanqingshengii]MCF0043654.1 hypothetical protein [Dyadobacter fanqingshengii]
MKNEQNIEAEDQEDFSTDAIKVLLAGQYTAWRDEVAMQLEPVVYPDHAWVVYSGIVTQEPQAAFTNREYAEILACHMDGALDPILMERTELAEMGFQVDKYKELVSFGKMPYNIILLENGEVFDSWGPQDGIPTIDEPTVGRERLSLGGTFWGWTHGEAVEEAQRLWKELNAKGQFKFINEPDQSNTAETV